jgi:hypothetical protein
MRSTASAAKDERAARRVSRHEGNPIQYRLPKTAVEPLVTPRSARWSEPVAEVVDVSPEEDYAPMVRGSLRAASALFLTQALSAILIANAEGAILQIRFAYKVIPHVAILATRDVFVTVLTWSTAFAVLASCLAVMIGLIRHRDEQKLLDGWASGLLMSGILVIFQYVRHVLDPPAIDGWVLAQTVAGVVAATVIFLGFRPEVERPAEAGRSSERAQPRSSGATRTNPRNKNKETTQS